MTTHCHRCNILLEETKEQFLLCKKCGRFTSNKKLKNNNIFKVSSIKKYNKKEEKMENETQKRGSGKKKILELLTAGKTVEEVVTETGIKKARVTFVKKKFFDKQ